MRIYMLSFHVLPKGPELKPGDIHEFEDDEAERLIGLGGARIPTDDELKAADTDGLRTDGPTVAEWVAAGYAASAYPPSGYTSKSTADEVEAAIAAQEQADTQKVPADKVAAAKAAIDAKAKSK